MQPRYMLGPITTYNAYQKYIIKMAEELPSRVCEVFSEIPNQLLSDTGLHVKLHLESCHCPENGTSSTVEEST